MELHFKNAVFSKGKNTTIRRGVKWDVCADKDHVLIYGDGADPVACVAISTRVKVFYRLTNDDIKYEHDPACQSYSGLLYTMEAIYPGFDDTEIVTIVDFEM